MASRLTPLDRTLRFVFDGDSELYRDHHGRRVVADVEGSGLAIVERAEAPLLVSSEDGLNPAFPFAFEEGLLVLTTAPGFVDIGIRQGNSPAPTEGKWVQGPFEGCGWIVSSAADLWVDGRSYPPPTPGLPVPFFRNVASDAPFKLAPIPDLRCRTVDAFEVANAEALKARGWKIQNASRLNELTSLDEKGEPRSGLVMSHLNAAAWDAEIPPENRGILLWKTYDRFHGRQRARVFIDGEFAGWWYEPSENRRSRWGVSHFGVPAEMTHGKTRIHIVIDPPAGAPLWSVSEISIDVLEPLA